MMGMKAYFEACLFVSMYVEGISSDRKSAREDICNICCLQYGYNDSVYNNFNIMRLMVFQQKIKRAATSESILPKKDYFLV
jgi:hypothetical protein